MDRVDVEAQGTLAAALRQVFNQLLRLLESGDPQGMLNENGPVDLALSAWRRSVAAQTAGLKVQQARELKNAKLELMGKVGILEKQNQDLKERNSSLRDEIVRLSKKQVELKQQVTDTQFTVSNHRDEARRLDLEVRELRRLVRKLEGGPPLTAEEAAPRSKCSILPPRWPDRAKRVGIWSAWSGARPLGGPGLGGAFPLV